MTPKSFTKKKKEISCPGAPKMIFLLFFFWWNLLVQLCFFQKKKKETQGKKRSEKGKIGFPKARHKPIPHLKKTKTASHPPHKKKKPQKEFFFLSSRTLRTHTIQHFPHTRGTKKNATQMLILDTHKTERFFFFFLGLPGIHFNNAPPYRHTNNNKRKKSKTTKI